MQNQFNHKAINSYINNQLLKKLKMRVPPKHIIFSSIWSLSISGLLSKRHVQDLDGRYSIAVHFRFSLHVLAQLFIVISCCIVDIHEEPTTFPPLKSNPCGHRASKIVGQAQGIPILIKNKEVDYYPMPIASFRYGV